MFCQRISRRNTFPIRRLATISPSNASTQTRSRKDIQDIYASPLLDLVFRAANVHRQHHDPSKIQLCTLMNIKSGGCSEDCAYCSQSSRYSTPTVASRLLSLEPVLEAARKAKENGSTRFCMGAAWRDLAGRRRGFERILEMVREVRAMGMEVCTTLGMVSPDQARQLKEAGLTAYNHNLDTSREFYPSVITTRSYDERLDTISAVRDAGISVCSGGILGLGESDEDRVGLIWEVSNMPEHPESFPVNALVPIPGTPLENNEPIPHQTILRTIATARIVMPDTIIRLAAGRQKLSESEQAMCFMAGANALFTGEAMLTTPCSPWDEDKAMMERWGLTGMESFEQIRVAERIYFSTLEARLDRGNNVNKYVQMESHYQRKRASSSLDESSYVASTDWDGLPMLQVNDEETELSISTKGGNWGNKLQNGARWVRKGKLVAWTPLKDDWEAEERARKRIKRMLPSAPCSPSPPRFSHLRSPSPPLLAPYPPPITQHLSFTSFVLDPAAQHSFRSGMVSDLERATGGLIEGEAALRRAMGRLWEALSDDADERTRVHVENAQSSSAVPKLEDTEDNAYSTRDDESGDEDGRSTAPELASNLNKIFISTPTSGDSPHANPGTPSLYDSTGMTLAQQQEDMLEKALSTLRELQEDGREYMERLEEIREGLGGVRSQKTGLWTVVRERALREMEEVEL